MFLNRDDFIPQQTLGNSEHLGVVTGICLVEARDDAKCPTIHRAVCTTKNYPAPNVSNAKIEKPCSMDKWDLLHLHYIFLGCGFNVFKKIFHIKTIMWINVFLLHMFCVVYIHQRPTYKKCARSEKCHWKSVFPLICSLRRKMSFSL